MTLAPAYFYLGRWGLAWHWPRHFGITIGFLDECWWWGVSAAWSYSADARPGESHYRRRFRWIFPLFRLLYVPHNSGGWIDSAAWTGRHGHLIGIETWRRTWVWGR